MVPNLAAGLRLLLVTDDRLFAERDPLACCRQAVAGGATAVQLRSKRRSDGDLLALARQLAGELPVPVLINDRLDLALAAGAHGVHLGPDDVAPLVARRIAPPGFVIGASVGSAEEVARGLPADYWGIGPVRRTATKSDAGDPLPSDGLQALLVRSLGRPCVAIGGVLPDDVPGLLALGFTGVAVASGILGADDIVTAAARYRDGG
jgi:thiamine-phosphate pyrophosphorylase